MASADQSEQLRRLADCTFLPGSPDKRFVRDMVGRLESNPSYELSERQVDYLQRLMRRYRRQLG